MNLTDSLFFDTDCLSAFLWVDEQSIITMLYPGRVVIPDAVYAELSHPRISHLKQRIDTLLNEHLLQIQSIIVGTPVYGLYQKLAMNPDAGMAVIGKGEASAIALAKESGGILASNNLKDVLQYVRLFSLCFVPQEGRLLSRENRPARGGRG